MTKLERTQSNVQQNKEQLHNPTMGLTNNNRTTALGRTAVKATGGLNSFYWYQIFALESAVIEARKC